VAKGCDGSLISLYLLVIAAFPVLKLSSSSRIEVVSPDIGVNTSAQCLLLKDVSLDGKVISYWPDDTNLPMLE